MRTVLQRVNHASVTVDDQVVGAIGKGIAVLVGFGKEDDESCLAPVASKLVNMRVFSNDNGRFDFSTLDIGGEVLLVPQFTLFADTRKGRRPEFFSAMEPKSASLLFDKFIEAVKSTGVRKTAAGVFGAKMKVAFENDGPVTIIVDS